MLSGVEGESGVRTSKFHEGRLLVCVLAHRNENVVFRKTRRLSKCPLHSTPNKGNSLWCNKLDILQGKMISRWASKGKWKNTLEEIKPQKSHSLQIVPNDTSDLRCLIPPPVSWFLNSHPVQMSPSSEEHPYIHVRRFSSLRWVVGVEKGRL